MLFTARNHRRGTVGRGKISQTGQQGRGIDGVPTQGDRHKGAITSSLNIT